MLHTEFTVVVNLYLVIILSSIITVIHYSNYSAKPLLTTTGEERPPFYNINVSPTEISTKTTCDQQRPVYNNHL